MRALWVIIAAVVIAIRAIPPEPEAPAAAATTRIVPLTDDEDVAFVDEIQTHPHWQLQFGKAWFTCTDEGFLDVYTITDDENVAWDERDMPKRRLSLTDGERETLRSITSLGTRALDGEPHLDPFFVSIGDLHAGRNTYTQMAGARIDRESPAGHALEDIFAAATDRYLASREAFLGEMSVTDRRGRAIDLSALDLHDRVDLADWALAQPSTLAGDPNDEYDPVVAWILVGAHRVGVTRLDGRPALWALQSQLR